MSGLNDGTSKLVLVEKASKSGVEVSTFRSFYQLAVYAIRMGAINDETAIDLETEIKEQNLDPYIKVEWNLDCDNLIDTDDARSDESEYLADEKNCIGLSACGGPCDDSCPAHRASSRSDL